MGIMGERLAKAFETTFSPHLGRFFLVSKRTFYFLGGYTVEEDAEKFRLTELGFAWDADEQGSVRVSVPPLRMMAGPVQHFRSAILNLHFRVFARLSERKGFWSVEFDDLKGSLQLLTSSHLTERDKMLLRAIFVGEYGTDSFLVKLRRKTFLVVFVGRRMVMDIYFWECSFLPLQHVRELPEFAFLCHWIAVSGHDAYSGMVGYLVLEVLFMMIPGLSLLVS